MISSDCCGVGCGVVLTAGCGVVLTAGCGEVLTGDCREVLTRDCREVLTGGCGEVLTAGCVMHIAFPSLLTLNKETTMYNDLLLPYVTKNIIIIRTCNCTSLTSRCE